MSAPAAASSVKFDRSDYPGAPIPSDDFLSVAATLGVAPIEFAPGGSRANGSLIIYGGSDELNKLVQELDYGSLQFMLFQKMMRECFPECVVRYENIGDVVNIIVNISSHDAKRILAQWARLLPGIDPALAHLLATLKNAEYNRKKYERKKKNKLNKQPGEPENEVEGSAPSQSK